MSTRLWIGGSLIGLALAGCSSNTTTSPDSTPQATPPKTTLPKTTKLETTTPNAVSAALKKIDWQPTYESALTRAAKEKKLVMIDFYATWCGPCKMMDEQTYTSSNVIQQSAEFVNVKVDIDKRTDLSQRYKISGIPALLWVDDNGKEIHRVEGFYPPDDFVPEMKTALTLFKSLS